MTGPSPRALRLRLILLFVGLWVAGAAFILLRPDPPGPDELDYPALQADPKRFVGKSFTVRGTLVRLVSLAAAPGPRFEAEVYNPDRDEKYFLHFSQRPLGFRPNESVWFRGRFARFHTTGNRFGKQIRAPLLVGKWLEHASRTPPTEAAGSARFIPLPDGKGVTKPIIEAAHATEPTVRSDASPPTYFDLYLSPARYRGAWLTLEGTVAQIRPSPLDPAALHEVHLVIDETASVVAYTRQIPDGLTVGSRVRAEGPFVCAVQFTNLEKTLVYAPALVAVSLERPPVSEGEQPDYLIWLAMTALLAIIYLFLRRRLTRGS